MRLVIALGVLVAVFWIVDIRAVLQRLQHLRPGPLILALALVQCQIVLSAERWRLTAAALGQSLRRRRTIAEYYVASLLNQLLPGGVSGDVIRAWRNRGDDEDAAGWQIPVRAIVIERLAGQLALAVIAAGGLLLWGLNVGQQATGGVSLLGVMALVFGGFGVAAWGLVRWAPPRVAGFVAAFGPALRRAWLARRIRWAQLGLSLSIVGSYLGVFALASASVGAVLSISAVVALVPLTLLTMLLPVSIAGWGMREAAAAALWPLAGATAADGVAASVVYGLLSLFGALPGVLWLLRGAPHVSPAEARQA